MKKNLTLLAGAAFGMLAFVSCSKNDSFVGSWQAVAPTDISSQISGVANASALTSISFGADGASREGKVELTSLIDVTQSVVENPALIAGYEVSVAATATISGTWAYAPGEDDELILTLDPKSLVVNVDPSGVTFRQNMVTGAQEPVTDSLTSVTASLWQYQLTGAMRKEFARYTRLDDVKVKNDSILKVEIENPDHEIYFRKI